MRGFLHFGYCEDTFPPPPKMTVEAQVLERHGHTYLRYETRLYRVKDGPRIGKHIHIKGGVVRVSLVED